MPDHFLWQEDSLRHEWELRFAHQPRPNWGVAELAYDEALLRSSGRLLIKRLQLVFETGLLIDIPGNAAPVSIDLPEDSPDSVDVFLHLESRPEAVKGGFSDREGSFVELRLQRVRLATRELETPLPGFRLLRLAPRPSEQEPPVAGRGWQLDTDFVPALISIFGLPSFGRGACLRLGELLLRWLQFLREQALENSLSVDKRVEARLYLRRARSLAWYLHQLVPDWAARARTEGAESGLWPRFGGGPSRGSAPPARRAAALGASPEVDRGEAPALRPHPFDLLQRAVELHLDIHAYRSSPLDTLQGIEPPMSRYRHDALGEVFGEALALIESELQRPGPGSPEWSFRPDAEEAGRFVCSLPEGARADSEVYFLVQFEGRDPEPATTEAGLDRRLLGLKLAAPNRLTTVEQRVLCGIVIERVRLVPFPHNFDSATVQFYRLKHGPEWTWAHRQGAVAYRAGGRPIARSFLYSPDISAARGEPPASGVGATAAHR